MAAKTFDQLIDFTRTSSATYVDATGKIAVTPASRNLLLFTQQFDNAYWNKTNASVTANSTTAPDGTLTADKLVGSAATGYHAVFRAIAGTAAPYAYSVYLKAAEYTRAILSNGSTGAWAATFDLSAGTVLTSTGGSVLGAAISPVGDGWYRCVVRYNGSATSYDHNVSGYPVGATLNNFGAQYTGDGTSGIFAWGAQVELGSTATTYTRNVGGVFPPRFDYDPVTLAPRGLLIEEQRTNLTLHSGLTSANWTATGGTLANTGKLSPDGSSNMGLFTEDSATSAHQAFVTTVPGAILTLGVTYTGSVYIAAGTRRYVVVQFGTNGSNWGVTVDTQTWTITGDFATGGCVYYAASIVSAGNGIYRVTATGVQNTGGATLAYVVVGGSLVADAVNSATSYLGNGSTFFAWGAQIEAGSFATSYIPTVASQVTRTADVATISGQNFSSWFNQTQGTLIAQASTVGTTGSRGVAGLLANGLSTNSICIYTSGATTGYGDIISGGVVQASFSPSIATQPINAALSYAQNNANFALNGAVQADDTSCTIPTGINQLTIGAIYSGSTFNINGHIRSIRYYPTRLSDAQLQALTA